MEADRVTIRIGGKSVAGSAAIPEIAEPPEPSLVGRRAGDGSATLAQVWVAERQPGWDRPGAALHAFGRVEKRARHSGYSST